MSFPSTYAQLTTDSLLDIFSLAPERLRHSIDTLTAIELESHPRVGNWSIQQIVFHVVDAEVAGHFRILSVLGSRDQPATLAKYDQESWAEELHYEDRSHDTLRSALHHFAVTREMETALLRDLDDAAWTRKGLHGEWGPVTLRQLLELYADHPERHIDQIREIRSLLGKPLNIPRVFDQWLYR